MKAEAVAHGDASRIRHRQKRMAQIVEAFQRYVATYTNQLGYEDYGDETFIADMLYGIGIAFDRTKFYGPTGFDLFKRELRDKHTASDASGQPEIKVNDDLGDRMKVYENAEAGRRLLPLAPVLARVDGRCFSSFTRGMRRPYDPTMSEAMIDTTIQLVKETNACMGYTQSDEITLAWHSTDPKSQIWFDGRVLKMASQLAALATLHFYRYIVVAMPDYAHRLPTFDARVWSVPNRTEGANVFLWREWDATKNSLTMAAAEHFSHKELHGKNGRDKHDMLHAKEINWNDYPAFFKRGTFVQRRTVSKPFSAEELDKLPPKHEARTNPGLLVERNEYEPIEMPPFASVTNREAVVFEGAVPKPETAGDAK